MNFLVGSIAEEIGERGILLGMEGRGTTERGEVPRGDDWLPVGRPLGLGTFTESALVDNGWRLEEGGDDPEP